MSSENVTVKAGFIGGAVTAGLHKLKHELHEFREEANKEFSVGNFLAAGAILESFHKIMEGAAKIMQLSERFGVSPEVMQRVTNAGKAYGVSIESVAMGLNKMIVTQSKVTEGDKEMAKELENLKIEGNEFINASPEEAFNMIADAVHNADNRTMAYGAVVKLMGRSAGELFSTLELGSEKISEVADGFGSMSNETVEHLHNAEVALNQMFSHLKVWGAEAFEFLNRKVAEWAAWTAGTVAEVKAAFGLISEEEAKMVNEAAAEKVKELNSSEHHEEKHGKPLDMDESGGEKGAEKLAKLYEKLDEQKRAAITDELEGQNKINDLLEQRNKLNEEASDETDPVKQAELWIKAGEAQKEVMRERERLWKETEAEEDRVAKKLEAYDKKHLENEMEGMTVAEKIKVLEAEKAKLTEKAKSTTKLEDQIDIMSQQEDLDKQIKGLNKKPEFEVKTSSLGRIGGGDIATLISKADPAERTARATEKNATAATQALTELKQIKDELGKSRWNP